MRCRAFLFELQVIQGLVRPPSSSIVIRQRFHSTFCRLSFLHFARQASLVKPSACIYWNCYNIAHLMLECLSRELTTVSTSSRLISSHLVPISYWSASTYRPAPFTQLTFTCNGEPVLRCQHSWKICFGPSCTCLVSYTPSLGLAL